MLRDDHHHYTHYSTGLIALLTYCKTLQTRQTNKQDINEIKQNKTRHHCLGLSFSIWLTWFTELDVKIFWLHVQLYCLQLNVLTAIWAESQRHSTLACTQTMQLVSSYSLTVRCTVDASSFNKHWMKAIKAQQNAVTF